jgi:hypothetical protein
MRGLKLIGSLLEDTHSGLMLTSTDNDQPASESGDSDGRESGRYRRKGFDGVVVDTEETQTAGDLVAILVVTPGGAAVLGTAARIGYWSGARWLKREAERRDKDQRDKGC